MDKESIKARLKSDLTSGVTTTGQTETYRYYKNGDVIIPITSVDETLELYEKLVVNKKATDKKIPRVSIFVGAPDTGKTYRAVQICKELNYPYILIMCRDSLNLDTLLENFVLEEGKPAFKNGLALDMLSGTEPCVIILDEFNTLLTGVMKTLQPIMDSTSQTFEYKGKIYNKNPHCHFILTMNEKDRGISILPDAILSRSFVQYFKQVSNETLEKWTGAPRLFINSVQKLYETLKISNLFGSRQISMLYGQDKTIIESHLIGLLALKGMDQNLVSQIEIQALISKLLC